LIKKSKIWLSPPHMGGKEQVYIAKAFKTNWISTVGPQITAFEKSLSDYIKARYVAALVSGTSAIHLALKILGVERGDVVVTQSFTFAATAFPITYLGANPVFIDSERDTWNMDPNIMEEAIISLIKKKRIPKAIIPVHLYGMPAQMGKIKEVASKFNIPIIEDAAEALGSIYQNKLCGSLGDMSILSFNGNKIITTSGGGALLSNNKKYILRAKFLATQAKDISPHYQHTEIGYNFQLGNINSAIGLGQMEVLDKRLERTKEIFEFYKRELADIDAITFQLGFQNSISNRWLTTILTQSFEQRESIRLVLKNNNIESRPLWKPMHLQPVFANAQYFGGKVAENLFHCGLCLPSGTALRDVDLKRIVGLIKSQF
jgi:dTDP-4-amino-4,6-dideoxygalactose transaminase